MRAGVMIGLGAAGQGFSGGGEDVGLGSEEPHA